MFQFKKMEKIILILQKTTFQIWIVFKLFVSGLLWKIVQQKINKSVKKQSYGCKKKIEFWQKTILKSIIANFIEQRKKNVGLLRVKFIIYIN